MTLLYILTEMFDYMPGFRRLMDTSESDTMDELCRLFAGFLHYTKILEMVAASSITIFLSMPRSAMSS